MKFIDNLKYDFECLKECPDLIAGLIIVVSFLTAALVAIY